MSVPYHRPLRGIAYRSGALKGSVPAGVDISYGTLPLTVTDFRGGPSLEMVKDALQMAEEQLAQAIAETGEHPWRAYLASLTANVANGGALPSVDSASKPIIGIWGAVTDASDGTVCQQAPLEIVRRRIANANTQFRLPVYWFNVTGRYIHHTRTNVKLEVCTYDAATQRTAIDANSNMLLPDVLETALVCGGTAFLSKEGADEYKQVFAVQLEMIRKGLVSLAVAEVIAA